MNSYVGTTMLKRQDNYCSQQSMLLTLPAYISPLTISSCTYVGW